MGAICNNKLCVRASIRRRFHVLIDGRNRPGRSDFETGNRPEQSDSEKGNGYNSAGGGEGGGGGRGGIFLFFYFFVFFGSSLFFLGVAGVA